MTMPRGAKVTKKKPMDCLSFAAAFLCRDATIEVNPQSWTDYKNSSLNLTGLVLSLSFILSLL